MKTERLGQLITLRFGVKDIKKKADNGVNGDISNEVTSHPEFDFKSYPWDQCISDNTEKYGEKGAAKVCGAIKNMTEQEEFMIPQPEPNEKKDEYITRCMKAIGDENKPQEQLLAICYAQLEK
ncbi:hypothetical protein UFOVP187_15 [uncultured Caudovirales phage]|uniref:Uncharacterized protein n=1 Tax=uncultured Caudovirales phage TaxID=2100421 RepID=A0A6J7WFN3_9CAUD|nr:hypothetical protein UFOVP187_15 [uncultured Caudovirales phage]